VVLKYEGQKTRILDLGTGSGCLILTLLSELPNATGVATDISPQALDIAKQNAEKLNVSDRIAFIESNWLESVGGEFDIIISNPPYIESKIIPELDKNVRDYDPMLALDGGEEGLFPYKVILPQIRTYLKKSGMMAMEHGYDQGEQLQRLCSDTGLSDVQTHKDLGGLDRVVTAIHT
jgi:release factor glutamine methyltransferase